jgi:hypothetical protein
VSIAVVLLAATACGSAHLHATLRPGEIRWPEAQQLLERCRVRHLEQTHSRLVTLTLADGRKVFAHEPRIDDIFRILNRLPPTCRPKTVATE